MLKLEVRLGINEILQDLENYRPRRKEWTQRKPAPRLKMGGFEHKEASEPMKVGVILVTAHNWQMQKEGTFFTTYPYFDDLMDFVVEDCF